MPSHGHLLHVTYLRYYKCVDSVAGCSSALLFQEILYHSQVSVPVCHERNSSWSPNVLVGPGVEKRVQLAAIGCRSVACVLEE